ncbi:major facilitator superfamily domain-containing protein [Leptodontidium sp. MPI-SDFR-AT-0119]|nr:major facilitator superfamily domain-containing protein [Leptodontidium sp. MPI-SDFR-AT-0119]
MDDKVTTLQPIATSNNIPKDLKFEQYPGTRLLVDNQHLLHAEHSSHDLVLIPQPSNDPDDPLRWSSPRKYLALGIVCLYSFIIAALTLSNGVLYGALIMDLHASVDYLNTGTAVGLLLIGFSNLFWNPMALKYGRRPVYLISAILTTVSMVMGSVAQTKGVYNGSRMLMGLAAGPFEQLPAVTVNDQFFVHHRGFGLSMYVLANTLGSFLGPLASGFVLESMGWRWVVRFYAIFMGMTAIIIFFGLEETGFTREIDTPSANGPATNFELPVPTSKKSYLAKLRLFSSFSLQRSLLATIIEPLKLILDPIVMWTGFLYGFGVAWLVVMSVSMNTVFQNPKYGYNFNFQDVGLTNISPLIGGLIMIYAGGAGTDRFMVWQARRNNGVMEPESRIYAVFLGGPIMAGGLFLYGPGAAAGLPWIAPVIGMALIGAGMPIVGAVSLGYVTESYPHKAGEASAAAITIRNIIGCCMVFANGPWIETGLRDAFITMGFLCLFVFWSGAFMIWKGKYFRGRTARALEL